MGRIIVGEKCGKERVGGGGTEMATTLALYTLASTSTRRLSAYVLHLLPIGVYHSYPFENIGAHAFTP